ncbi:MAG: branched-chain amino acid ABC transporter permease [Candidatus Rokuibacteriota bacterium]|nr:MAG: branched-chain amino acid ABC transporter permease [Candidatus Rokubacteria bacterium]
MAPRTAERLRVSFVVAAAVVALALPNFADDYIRHVAARLFVYALVALGLNLLTGFAGQVSLGHAAFFAIGAYTAAALAERWQWPSALCVLAAAFFTGVVGYLLGLPCLRLSGLYLAMATLGFTFIVQEMLLQLAVITHGSEGMRVKPAAVLGFTFDSDYRKYYLLLGVTVVMLLFARNLVRGRTGRAFLAIRENERAAEAMGVHLAQYKTIAFAISALYTGLAGALSAFLVGFLDPQEFSFFLSIQFITIIILGGLASLLGSLLGAAFLVILPELLAGLDVWQALVYGLIMVVTIIFMPFGLSGAIRRYRYRWFGIGVEPVIPRRLGH